MNKKVLSLLLICTLIIPFRALAYSTATADKLKSLGLFLGTDYGYELDRTLTRAEAAALIVRSLGVESEVKNGSFGNQFSDVANNHWAVNYINYCYKHGITKGVSPTEYAPSRTITGAEFATLLIRSMGYTDAEPGNIWDYGIKLGIFTNTKANTFRANNDCFLRNYTVELIYSALRAKCSNGVSLAENLVAKGVFTRAQGINAGVIYQSGGSVMDDLEWALKNKLK